MRCFPALDSARIYHLLQKLIFVCVALILIAPIGNAKAARPNLTERITDFSSDIQIEENGSINVREKIAVFVYGEQIRKGIFRDIPYVRTSLFGFYELSKITVNSVRRDGKYEPFEIRDFGSFVRIIIGNANRSLVLGDHVYEITYTMSDQIAFGSHIDELYWNVTGNGWRFWIERAKATIQLPSGAEADSLAVYTGKIGEQGTNFEIVSDNGAVVEAKTFSGLRPNEGLTVAVSWPSGFVKHPDFSQRFYDFGLDNKGILAGFALTLVLLGYLTWSWTRFGRDPSMKSIIPHFEPPAGLSAAEVGFLWRKGNGGDGYITRAFAVILTSLAVRKKLSMEVTNQGAYILTRLPVDNSGLFEEEIEVLERLVPQDGNGLASIGSGYNEDLYNARNRLAAMFDRRRREKYIKHNRDAWRVGCLIAVMAVATTFLLDPMAGAHQRETIIVTVTLSIMFVFGVNLIFNLLFRRWNKIHRYGVPTSRKYFGFAITCLGFLAPVFVVGYLVIGFISPIPIMVAVSAVVICCLFNQWLEVPTEKFNELYVQILGYRRYLSVAEEGRLNFDGWDANELIELFEAHLPYAMALDVEDVWTSRFEEALMKFERAGKAEAAGYNPTWYSDRERGWRGIGSFGNRSSGHLSAAGVSYGAPVSSAAGVASGSSSFGGFSGGGGGGFSGGGGGGGGGGGW